MKLKSGRPKLNKGHPRAAGLIAAYAFPSGYGQDLVGFSHLTTKTGTISYDGIRGLITHISSTTTGLQGIASASLKFPTTATLVWQGTNFGSPNNSAGIFGVTYDNTGSSPYYGYAFQYNTPPQVAMYWNNGSLQSASWNQGMPSGSNWVAGTITSGSQKLYVNDPITSIASNTATGTISYSSSAQVFFGTPAAFSGRNPDLAHEYGLIYNRILTNKELAWLLTNGRDLFVNKRNRIISTVPLITYNKFIGPGGLIYKGK